MAKYRKKPVVIDAFRWEGADSSDWPIWFCQAIRDGIVTVLDNGEAVIKTLEGEAVIVAEDRNWILRGVVGELYPCRQDVFEATYEPVE